MTDDDEDCLEARVAAAGKYLLELVTFIPGTATSQLADIVYDLLSVHGQIPCPRCREQPCQTALVICNQVEAMIVERAT